MEEKYFVIHNSDGDTTVQQFTKEELLRNLKEEFYGPVEILDELPGLRRDTNYWGNSILIIKGDVVCPRPVKVVEEFDID